MPVAAVCYFVLTVWLFRNLLPVIPANLFSDLGDPPLNTSILAWNAKHVPLTSELELSVVRAAVGCHRVHGAPVGAIAVAHDRSS